MVGSLTTLWKRLKKTDIDKWVEFIEHPASNEMYAVHIKKGTFKDIVYFYGKVNLVEINDSLVLKYDTTVVENPRKHNIHSNKFKKLTGDILRHQLSQVDLDKAVLSTEYVSGENDIVIDEVEDS